MQPIETFRSKREMVYQALRKAILQGDLAPGARLVIDDLAEQLGVSPIPVREALQQLQSDGFVTSEPYVGARVSQVDVGLVWEVFDLLEALEVVSGRAACRRLNEEALAEVAERLSRMDDLIDAPDRFSHENARLHRFICQQAETPLVNGVMGNILAHWDRLRRHYLTEVFAHRIEEAQQEHWRILEALRTRDPDRVEHVIREHNQSSRKAYVEHLRAKGLISAELTAV